MMVGVGIALAFVAMLSWGFGDFLIQKSTRKVGDWETLFLITLFGAVVLLPFVWSRIPALLVEMNATLVILVTTSVVLFIAALLDFEALRRGKLSIVEPIWSLEVPAAALLAYFLLGERITLTQTVIIFSLIICLILVGLRSKKLHSSMLFEKGAALALLGALFMGGANFFMGVSGRVSDPLMANFFTDAFIALITGAVLLSRGKLMSSFRDFRDNYTVLLPMSIADKVAWLAYVFSMSLAPIAISTAFSESYIIVAVLLGLAVNREKLMRHQKFGLAGALVMIVALAITVSG